MGYKEEKCQILDAALWLHERFRYSVVWNTESIHKALYPKAEAAGLNNHNVRGCIWWMIDCGALTLEKDWSLTKGPNYDTFIEVQVARFKQNYASHCK